jgi:hypothetical protein
MRLWWIRSSLTREQANRREGSQLAGHHDCPPRPDDSWDTAPKIHLVSLVWHRAVRADEDPGLTPGGALRKVTPEWRSAANALLTTTVDT